MPKLSELNIFIYLTVSESKTDLSSLILPLHMIYTLGPQVRERKTKWAAFFKTSFPTEKVVQEWCLRQATYFSGWAAENFIWGPSPLLCVVCLWSLSASCWRGDWCPILDASDFWLVCNVVVSYLLYKWFLIRETYMLLCSSACHVSMIGGCLERIQKLKTGFSTDIKFKVSLNRP